MSLTIGPAFTIPGYDAECGATLHAADSIVAHPALWSHYLSGVMGTERESEAAFEVSAAGYDAMFAVLTDPERWPVVSVPLGGDAWLRIVFRNFEEDAGLDFVEERPGRPAKVVASIEGHGFESAMTWAELLAAAALPDGRLTGAQRLVLMLPMLGQQELPDDAGAVLDKALAGTGAGNREALAAAMLDGLDWCTR
ncbi:hypothetical protein JNW88_15870 [Micromonospora sp. ATA32]|nr:hypothetical protein [Micromonospora sp. ATA32]